MTEINPAEILIVRELAELDASTARLKFLLSSMRLMYNGESVYTRAARN